MTQRTDAPAQAVDFNNEDSNTSANPTFESVLGARLSRRGLLRGGVGSVGTALLTGFGVTACGGGDGDAGRAAKRCRRGGIAQQPCAAAGIHPADEQDRRAHCGSARMATGFAQRVASARAARQARSPLAQANTTRCPGAGARPASAAGGRRCAGCRTRSTGCRTAAAKMDAPEDSRARSE